MKRHCERCVGLDKLREKGVKELRKFPKKSLERRRILKEMRKIQTRLRIFSRKCGKRNCEHHYENLEWPEDILEDVCEKCIRLNQRRTRHKKNGQEYDLTKRALNQLQLECFKLDCCLYHIFELKNEEKDGIIDEEGVIIKY